MNNKIEQKVIPQDKPIRPRYGLPEMDSLVQENEQRNYNNDDEDKNLIHAIPIRGKNNASEGNENDVVASSYSEIPFAAQQYTQDNASCQITTDEHEANHSNPACTNAELLDNEHENQLDEIEDDEEDNEASHNLDGNDHYFYAAQKSNSNGSGAYGMTTLMARHLQQQQQVQEVQKQQQQLPQIDADVLNDIEIDAQYLAASVDNLLENLCSLLHSISSITADNVGVHRNAVNRMTDSMDANIKCMYTIMAKTEEITKSMKPTEHLAQRIREIKRLVDMLESTM